MESHSEDQFFHLVLAALTAALTALGAVTGRLTRRDTGRGDITLTRG